MSQVWSCNEWDPLEEVIVGNPLGARFPHADPSTRLNIYAYGRLRARDPLEIRYVKNEFDER